MARAMKDSGIEWIGEIPEDWNVFPIKYNFEMIAGATPDSTNTNMWDGDILWITPADYKTKDIYVTHGARNLSELGYRSCSTHLLPVGTIVVSKRAPIGSVAITAKSMCTNQGCLGLVRKSESISEKYFYYTLSIYDDVLNLFGSGTTFKEISASVFGRIRFVNPPTTVQQRIVSFLDAKCAEIDALMADVQAQIETLEQYKRSVITEAVTKGLNPNVPMKDSHVPWIGKIPETWGVDNPKWHFIERKDRAYPGLVQLTASQKYGVITQEEYMQRTGARVVVVQKDFDILKLVCPGDFVIHMRSFQGGLEYSELKGSTSSAYIMLIPKATILEPRYYRWFFKSDIYIDALSSTTNLVRDGQAMRWANFIQLPILFPSKEEQQAIASYLGAKCAEIDAIIDGKRQQLAVLEEYKKSVIFEYVTGKKEVPVA